MSNRTRLPVLRAPQPPAMFQPGERVVLRNCPEASGIVKGVTRSGKILVAWHDLHIIGKRQLGSLTLVADHPEHPAAGPQLAQDAPAGTAAGKPIK